MKNESFAFSEAFILGLIRFSFIFQKLSASGSRISPPLKRITTLIESPSNRSVSGYSRSVYSVKEDLLVSERNEDALDIKYNISKLF